MPGVIFKDAHSADVAESRQRGVWADRLHACMFTAVTPWVRTQHPCPSVPAASALQLERRERRERLLQKTTA